MERNLIRYFFGCGDDQIIRFAMERAHLNAHERNVLYYMIDECNTQEQTAEILQISVRNVQGLWKSATDKMLKIPWVICYAKELRDCH